MWRSPATFRVEPGRGHVSRTDRLDLLDLREFLSIEQLVEIADHLIQHANELATTCEISGN
jgi:hypothetical protein